MCAGQGAIVTTHIRRAYLPSRHSRDMGPFPRQNLQASRYPPNKAFRSLPSPLRISLASTRIHSFLAPFMVELFAGRSLEFNRSPLNVIQRLGQSPGQELPTPAALRELAVMQALVPPTGLRTNDLRSIAVEHAIDASPALFDTAFSHRLLSRRSFRVAQIHAAHKPIPFFPAPPLERARPIAHVIAATCDKRRINGARCLGLGCGCCELHWS